MTTQRSRVVFSMIQTLQAEIDETGSVRLCAPVNFDRKHRVLVMVMPEEGSPAGGEETAGWDSPYVDLPYRYLPSAS